MEINETTQLEARVTADLPEKEIAVLAAGAEEQEEKPKPNKKKRIPLILVPLALITLIILSATGVISTVVFTSILLSIVGIANVLVLCFLIRDVKRKKGIKKWIVLLAKLVPMIPLLSLYLAGVIPSTLFIILKVIMLGAFIIFALTMFIISKSKSKKKEQDISSKAKANQSQQEPQPTKDPKVLKCSTCDATVGAGKYCAFCNISLA